MRSSRVGQILTLIGGIVTLIVALAPLVGIFGLILGSSVLPDFIAFMPVGLTITYGAVLFVMFVIFGAILATGILKIYASNLMREKKTTQTGGIWALVLGFISGDVLSMVGGVFGIVQGSR